MFFRFEILLIILYPLFLFILLERITQFPIVVTCVLITTYILFALFFAGLVDWSLNAIFPTRYMM
jgi:hypothetical protein